eukprot:15354470-Ditylum_brightwellii.AAC.1
MARNWLTAAMLPAQYWWFAIKQACEVQDMLPTSHIKNKVSAPYELVYGEKVDYRDLIPLFSAAYIRHAREEGKQKSK